MDFDSCNLPARFAAWLAWWEANNNDDIASEKKKIPGQLLRSPSLCAYWRRIDDRFQKEVRADLLDTAYPWLIGCFWQAAKDELHLTGTASRPTRKVRIRGQHKRDRERAGTAAENLRGALRILGGQPPSPMEMAAAAEKLRGALQLLEEWECILRPDELVGYKFAGAVEELADILDRYSLARRAAEELRDALPFGGPHLPVAEKLRDALRLLEEWERTVQPGELFSHETTTSIEKLAEALEQFGAVDALKAIEGLASHKASWRDYVKAVHRELLRLGKAYDVDVQPSITEWQSIIHVLTGKTPDQKDVRQLIRSTG